jgi:hypothetical protein
MAKLKKKVRRRLKNIILLIIIVCVVIFFGKNINKDNQESNINTGENNIVITVDNKDIYLIKGEEYKIDYNKSLKYEYDKGVISFNEGIIKANNKGNTKLTITNGKDTKEVNITVTDLLVTSTVNNSKSYLGCHEYSESDALLLDKVLEFKINEKGYLTRAGALEAARFLTLNFPYKLKYFFENGRLDRSNSFFDYVDGEGRYYHKGVYLTDNKFSDLKASLRGPQPWGCSMPNDTTKQNNPNGLDCSGFITWALVNAGYDPGDVGAGPNTFNDITDIGKIVYFTDEGAFDNVKVGDLIGRNGHIAMLVGYDGNKYYVGEALDRGEYDMHVYSYTKEELMNTELQYFVYMDDFYKEDGNITNMW